VLERRAGYASSFGYAVRWRGRRGLGGSFPFVRRVRSVAAACVRGCGCWSLAGGRGDTQMRHGSRWANGSGFLTCCVTCRARQHSTTPETLPSQARRARPSQEPSPAAKGRSASGVSRPRLSGLGRPGGVGTGPCSCFRCLPRLPVCPRRLLCRRRSRLLGPCLRSSPLS
jgi:hypothetical protein